MDGLALEHCALHVLDHLLLLLAELLIPELHPVYLLLHVDYLGLPNVGVQRILHLPFELDLALP